MTEAEHGRAGLIAGGVETRALIPLPGLVWRSCRFRTLDIREYLHRGAEGELVVRLPDDLGRAVAKRRSEFLAGRVCAGLALRALGLAATVGRAGRAPVWPAGAAGSISHAGGRAIAVVSSRLRGVGVDCETVMGAEKAAEIASLILTDAERAARPGGWPPGLYLTALFAAKEAAYKAVSGHLGDIPDFHEGAADGITRDGLRITLRGWHLPVRLCLDEDQVIALAWID